VAHLRPIHIALPAGVFVRARPKDDPNSFLDGLKGFHRAIKARGGR
jgi:hypothetical protein